MSELLTEERKIHETKPYETKSGPTEEANSAVFSQKNLSRETSPQDTLSDLFQDRDHPRDQKPVSDRDQKIPVKPQQERKSAEQEEDFKSSDLSKKEEEKNEDASKRQEASVELQRLQEELEKTQKRLTENQQYGRQNAQRLKTALKVVKELEEEGSLNEDEAARLMESLERENDVGLGAEDSHPLAKVLAIANQELENIRKYTDDTTLDDKVRAFDYFLMVAPKEEQEQALEELMDLKETPLKLAKTMLEKGQRYEKSYQEMKSSGSLYGLLTHKDQEIDKLRKSIDKLTKKLSHYEDYDKPRYRLDEMGESEEKNVSRDTITSLFQDRDQVRRR